MDTSLSLERTGTDAVSDSKDNNVQKLSQVGFLFVFLFKKKKYKVQVLLVPRKFFSD